MDLVLLLPSELAIASDNLCFNPYFNGSSTSTSLLLTMILSSFCVSILILMDLVLLLKDLYNSFRGRKKFQSLF